MDGREQAVEYKEERTFSTVLEGSITEGFIALGAVAVAIIGLAGVLINAMLYIATVLIGAALFFKGLAVSSRFSQILEETEEDTAFHRAELGMGTTAESLGGIGGAVLGILAIGGVAPMTLVSVAAIVFGGSILLGSGVNFRLNSMEIARTYKSAHQRSVARTLVASASDVQMIVGLGTITLGILSLIGIAPYTLTMVSMLSIGGANFLSETAISGRLLSLLRR